jgi:hypothetical protein
LQAKRKASEKLEKLNKGKEQIEAIQREMDEMKEQENSSLWQQSPLHNSEPNRRTLKENFFVGNGISQFVDSDHLYPQGCKLHHGHQSSNQSLSQNIMASETPGNSS